MQFFHRQTERVLTREPRCSSAAWTINSSFSAPSPGGVPLSSLEDTAPESKRCLASAEI